MDKYERWYRRNEQGHEFEKQGRVEDAIAIYEVNVVDRCDTPFTYKRLAILYRRLGEYAKEIRVLERALERIQGANKKVEWFRARFSKARAAIDTKGV